MPETAPVFVGGTGRSGTTQLAAVLGQHPRIWSLAQESRFLVDPGGLEDLVPALTETYTPFHATDALDRLRRLLTRKVTGGDEGVFADWNLPELLGGERYHAWTESLLDELTWYRYAAGGAVGRYFPDRTRLVALLSERVDALFRATAADHGKPVWCEKTPLNALSAPFLWELFPDARVVHIVRHPERVVVSHLDQPWAPDDAADVCSWLEPIYDRLLAVRDTFDPNRYLEVRLEDLATDWPRRRAALFAWLGLPDHETELGFEPGRHTHAWRRLTDGERTIVRDRLGPAYEAFGYER